MRANLYRLTVGLSYLLAGLWFGSLVGFVITAIRVFATVRAYEPGLADSPEAGAVPAGQAPDALAGAVVGGILGPLLWVQVVCLLGLALLALAQGRWLGRFMPGGFLGKANLLRLGLFALAGLGLAVQLGWIGPQIWDLRQAMYDPDRPAAEREEARKQFETYHTASERTMGVVTLLVGAGIVASPFALTPRPGTAGRS